MTNLSERRVWLLCSVAAMSAADIHELTGWPLADIEPLFARAIASATSTREALECVFSRARGATIGATTIGGVERAVEAKQGTLRALLRKAAALPWDELVVLHLEQLGRLVLHADGRRSLTAQLEALRHEERWSTDRPAQRRERAVAHRTVVPAFAIVTVTLAEVTPPVWRRVSVPLTYSLRELHDVIQLAMGWTHSHLHQFTISEKRYTPPVPIDDEDLDALDDRSTTLGNVARAGFSFEYEYDFGDCWRHEVVIDRVLGADRSLRLECLGGAGACPPEDCGGCSGYALLVDALANPRHPEHEALSAWAPPGFDAWLFDLDRANERLHAYVAGRLSREP